MKSQFKIGDRVSVIPRFGEAGTIKEIKSKKFGIKFNGLPFVLWYYEKELKHIPKHSKEIIWFKMPQPY